MPLYGLVSKKEGWGVFVGYPLLGPSPAPGLALGLGSVLPLLLPPGLPGHFDYLFSRYLLPLFLPCFPPLVGPLGYSNCRSLSGCWALWPCPEPPVPASLPLPEHPVDPVAGLCNDAA